MNKICQCKCKKKTCVQCDINVGYAIGKFFNDVNIIDASLIGADDGNGNTYIGKCEAECGGICDILFPTDTVGSVSDNFVPELKLRDSLKGNMSDYLQLWINSNSGGIKTMKALKEYEEGKKFISPFNVGTSVTPHEKKGTVCLDNMPRIKALKFKLKTDAAGRQHQMIEITSNVAVSGKKTFKAPEFLNVFSVSGCTTKNSGKYIKMTDGGIVRPVCLKYPKFNIMIDNVYVYMDDGHKTIPIGNWGTYTLNKSDTLDNLVSNKEYSKISEAINCLEKMRKFIAPYWCIDANVINAQDI